MIGRWEFPIRHGDAARDDISGRETRRVRAGCRAVQYHYPSSSSSSSNESEDNLIRSVTESGSSSNSDRVPRGVIGRRSGKLSSCFLLSQQVAKRSISSVSLRLVGFAISRYLGRERLFSRRFFPTLFPILGFVSERASF